MMEINEQNVKMYAESRDWTALEQVRQWLHTFGVAPELKREIEKVLSERIRARASNAAKKLPTRLIGKSRWHKVGTCPQCGVGAIWEHHY